MTDAQLQALAAAIRADVLATPTAVIPGYTDNGTWTLSQAMTVRNDIALTAWENSASTFIAWKSSVTIRETGQAFNGTEWAGMTTANHTRLQTVAQYLSAYSPGLADIRAMFNDIWSGAGGTITRPALLALWKRQATRAEKVFATGNGADATPGTLVFEGQVSTNDVGNALNRF